MANPKIIINHTIVAAAARRWSFTLFANSASKEVPLILTPTPIITNAINETINPRIKFIPRRAVPNDAKAPPNASTPIPPIIHGVFRLPWSDMKPILGRITCTK